MVENNPNSSYLGKLKLKGTEGQSIDLQNLTNLKKTKENEALFKKYDKDGDGSINKDEAKELADQLHKAAGNGKISQRELNKALGMKGKDAFYALQRLAYQQDAKFEIYNESETVINKQNNSVTNPDGSVSHYDDDGKLKYIAMEKTDNTHWDTEKQDYGKSTYYYSNKADMENNKPYSIYHENSDGTSERTDFDYKNNTKTITNTECSTTKSYKYDDINSANPTELETTTVSYLDDGIQITTVDKCKMIDGQPRTYEIINNPNNPAKKEVLQYEHDDEGHITKITKQKGQVTTTYASEEDLKADKPSEIKRNTGLDALDHTTTFTESNGFRTGVEKNVLGRPSKVEIKDAKGQPVEKMSIDVQKGDSFDKVIDKLIEKYNLPKEDSFIRSFVKKTLVAENYKEDGTGLCKQMKSGKYKGNYYFLAGKKAELSTEGLNKILNRDATATTVKPLSFTGNKETEAVKIDSKGLEDFGFKQHDAFQSTGHINVNGENVLIQTNSKGEYTIYQDTGKELKPYHFDSKEQLLGNLKNKFFIGQNFGNSKGIENINDVFIANNESTPKYRAKDKIASETIPKAGDTVAKLNANETTTINKADGTTIVTSQPLQPKESKKTVTSGTWDYSNDTIYQTSLTEINRLKSDMNDILTQMGLDENATPEEFKAKIDQAFKDAQKINDFDKRSNTMDNLYKLRSKYHNTSHYLQSANNNMTMYKKTMDNWQDGKKGIYTKNYVNYNIEQTTLKNGQRAYLIDGDFYPVGNNGMPDLAKGKINID